MKGKNRCFVPQNMVYHQSTAAYFSNILGLNNFFIRDQAIPIRLTTTVLCRLSMLCSFSGARNELDLRFIFFSVQLGSICVNLPSNEALQ